MARKSNALDTSEPSVPKDQEDELELSDDEEDFEDDEDMDDDSGDEDLEE